MSQDKTDICKKLEETIEKYADTVKRICFMYIKNHADVDDIMQEVFIKYLLHNGKFKSELHEKSWISLVTANQCKDYLKSYWKRNVSPIGESEFEAPEENESYVLEYIKMLPEKYRMFIYLVYYEGYTVSEISKMMGINANTVYSGLFRARALLKNYIGGDKDK